MSVSQASISCLHCPSTAEAGLNQCQKSVHSRRSGQGLPAPTACLSGSPAAARASPQVAHTPPHPPSNTSNGRILAACKQDCRVLPTAAPARLGVSGYARLHHIYRTDRLSTSTSAGQTRHLTSPHSAVQANSCMNHTCLVPAQTQPPGSGAPRPSHCSPMQKPACVQSTRAHSAPTTLISWAELY